MQARDPAARVPGLYIIHGPQQRAQGKPDAPRAPGAGARPDHPINGSRFFPNIAQRKTGKFAYEPRHELSALHDTCEYFFADQVITCPQTVISFSNRSSCRRTGNAAANQFRLGNAGTAAVIGAAVTERSITATKP
jgi:hypothetical protein